MLKKLKGNNISLPKPIQASQQGFGYSIQKSRMLYHLLIAESSENEVSLELHDDVSVIKADGTWYLEQATTSQDGNPFANKSPKPWKAIANWVKGIENNLYPADETIFVLYSLQPRQAGSVIKLFHDAKTIEEANKALLAAKKLFKKEEIANDKKEHLTIIFDDKYKNTVLKIIVGFCLKNGTSNPSDEILLAIKNEAYSEARAKQFKTWIEGWIRDTTNDLLAINKKPIISRKQFLNAQSHFNEKFCLNSRLEFVLEEFEDPLEEDILDQVRRSPLYIKQLKIIDMDQGALIRAAGDYLKASVYRTKMSESGEYPSTSFLDYEDELKVTWQNEVWKNDDINICDITFGKKLYGACNSTNKDFSGKQAPEFFTRGNYHYLANAPLQNLAIGWHRKFLEKLEEYSDIEEI